VQKREFLISTHREKYAMKQKEEEKKEVEYFSLVLLLFFD